MSKDNDFLRRDVLRGAAAGGLTVAAATAALTADARAAGAVKPPKLSGRDKNEEAVFLLELDNQPVGYFTECSGIGSESEVIEHKVVNKTGQEVIVKIPGRLRNTDVTLKRGISSDLQIWEWRELVVQGNFAEARRMVSIAQVTPKGAETARWSFTNGWPVAVETGAEAVSTGSSRAGATEIQTYEEVTIAHEGVFRET